VIPLSPWLLALASGVLAFGMFAAYRAVMGRRMRQSFREAGPEHHKLKGAVPTGAGIVFVVLLLLAGIIAFPYVEAGTPSGRLGMYVCLAAALMGLLGWIDDRRKVVLGSEGLKARYKFPVMIAVGLGLLYFISTYFVEWQQALALTGDKLPWPVGAPWWLFYSIGLFVWLGALNGANFTDGLDGLLTGTTLVVLAGAFYALLDGTDPEALPAAVGFGALVAFLYFNRKPARLYMGDSGALAVGALVAGLFLAKGWWLFLGLAAVVWVIEVTSVMLQVGSYRTLHRRIFLMSPLHHHFELAGLSETVIVWLFIGLQVLGCATAIAWLRLGLVWGLAGTALLLIIIALLLACYRRRVR